MGVREEIVHRIRVVNPDNQMLPSHVALEIADVLERRGYTVTRAAVIDYVTRVNPHRLLTAEALAAAVVTKFNLDQEK